MRLKSYLLITGITAAALFGAAPAFAEEVAPDPTDAPSPVESAPEQASPDPMLPTDEECQAMLDERGAPWTPEEEIDLGNGATCEEIIAEWEEARDEERADEAGNGAPPAQPQPADPNYTG
ncbi:hypothetical protein DFP74_1528 [Nocardiopsis sp. Huas11]|uniref:hypothetical protein n=1 Tax=Nocardiopsis sp. Huas11 TaxID=2183912 RepID=UPI000EB57123|nr:hypothetical protein [Nocardiopsis sp. Huas11]RKS05912.1 hypothetical protein DFP74_1528 [Nocardiopsis sp. Huas11]